MANFGYSSRPLLVIGMLLYRALLCSTQSGNTFSFPFDQLAPNSELLSCLPYHLSVGYSRYPPIYYLYAYELGGVTSVSTLNASNNYMWTVSHRPGTQLMLSVTDANGNSGGVSGTVYGVIPGATDCLPPPANQSFFMISNVTGNLEPCQPLGLAIEGGSPPYSLSFVSLNATAPVIVTLPSVDNALTYINAAPPGIAMSVHDSTGTWGIGTSLIYTVGPLNSSCNGTSLIPSQTSDLPPFPPQQSLVPSLVDPPSGSYSSYQLG
ncbi:hypothetical protein JAAARDRAFT_200204 [Jaapia argillacea MUCL 33604]|uniref:Uncharacterized protein n=1 Tax=Jaapia argillacea MUCL 33604 TaxID=933084 RepID=A0A067P5M1_9AGAM|nr:hypothetical protein JAAARDRAFT_200204 [Jaapia argillacea MUCL 33604]